MFHFPAAHCIRGSVIIQHRYVLDFVRLGEHDLRTDPDCKAVRGGHSHNDLCKPFQFRFSFLCFNSLIWLGANRPKGKCADLVQDIPVAEAEVHENYTPTSGSQANDIALIRLQRTTLYNDFIRPICLPIAEDLRNKNYDGLALKVAGFGRTETGMYVLKRIVFENKHQTRSN